MDKTYKRFFDECPIGLYMTRAEDGLFLNINAVGAKMLGYKTPEEVIDKVYSTELYNRDDRQKILDLLDDRKRISDYEVRFCRKDGTCIWVSLSATNGGDTIMGSIEDITVRKELEEEVDKLQQQMLIPLKNVAAMAKRRIELYDRSAAEFGRLAQSQ